MIVHHCDECDAPGAVNSCYTIAEKYTVPGRAPIELRMETRVRFGAANTDAELCGACWQKMRRLLGKETQ